MLIGCITDGKRPHEYEEELSEYKDRASWNPCSQKDLLAAL